MKKKNEKTIDVSVFFRFGFNSVHPLSFAWTVQQFSRKSTNGINDEYAISCCASNSAIVGITCLQRTNNGIATIERRLSNGLLAFPSLRNFESWIYQRLISETYTTMHSKLQKYRSSQFPNNVAVDFPFKMLRNRVSPLLNFKLLKYFWRWKQNDFNEIFALEKYDRNRNIQMNFHREKKFLTRWIHTHIDRERAKLFVEFLMRWSCWSLKGNKICETEIKNHPTSKWMIQIVYYTNIDSLEFPFGTDTVTVCIHLHWHWLLTWRNTVKFDHDCIHRACLFTEHVISLLLG